MTECRDWEFGGRFEQFFSASLREKCWERDSRQANGELCIVESIRASTSIAGVERLGVKMFVRPPAMLYVLSTQVGSTGCCELVR